MRITKNAYAVLGLAHEYGVNAGFVETKKHIVAIDSGFTYLSAQTIIAYIKAVAQNKPIKFLILTEYHSDHVFGSGLFKERGAKIIGHEKLKNYLNEAYVRQMIEKKEKDQPKLKGFGSTFFGPIKLSSLDITITKDTDFNIDGEKFKIILTPGHTDSNICVYLPRSKVLFAGDAIYSGYPLTTRFGNQTMWEKWIKSIKKIEELDVAFLVPGHGPICNKSQMKKEFKRHIEFLSKMIR